MRGPCPLSTQLDLQIPKYRRHHGAV